MSDTQGWYARKLAAVRGHPQPQPYQQTYQAPTQRQTNYPGQASPMGGPPPPQVEARPTDWGGLLQRAAADGHLPGHRTNPENCPQCNSPQYFKNIPVSKRSPPPAGHCYNCGYNDGMFTQGLESSWTGPIQTE